MTTNLIVFQIILPLIGAIISFLTPKNMTWLVTTITVFCATVLSLILYKAAANDQVLTYHFGGWFRSIGIEYQLTKLNAFFVVLVSFVSLFSVITMRDLVAHEVQEGKSSLFFTILLISLTGLFGLCLSNDIFNIYVMLEVNTIASYALVAAARKPSSSEAAFDYLIFSTIGSTMILLGIGFIYAMTGSLNLSDISDSMPRLLDSSSIRAGIGLMLLGILMKAALFPLSKWLIDIYQNAPSGISAILSAASNKVAIYLLFRFFFEIFKINTYPFEYLNILLLSLAVIAIFVCAILAYRQDNIKRFLGYSSLSQIGFVIFALALASKVSISGLLIYCVSHALEKTVLFLAVGLLIIDLRNEDINSFAGLRKRSPWLCVVIVINLLSNVGFPMTLGFVGKWQLFKAALATDIWYILLMLTATLFSFMYAFRFIEIMLFQNQKKDVEIVRSRKLSLVVLSAVTLLNIYAGINNQYLLDIAKDISQMILK